MDDRRIGRARMARRTALAAGILAALGVLAVPAGAAAAAIRIHDIAVVGDTVTADVGWIDSGPDAARLVSGDVRLVAVDEDDHQPRLIDAAAVDLGTGDRDRRVTLHVGGAADRAAMRRGNRVVLTASQHPLRAGLRTQPTYVTVGEVQPFGSPQRHVGTRDCAAIPVEPGAHLAYCDLVGADLDGAQVSEHDDAHRRSTRLERADLTGATLAGASLAGASIAGGSMVGADLRRANLDNLSLAGTDARDIDARGATSDQDSEDTAANFFGTLLDGADLRDTTFNGVSVAFGRLDHVRATGAHWTALDALGASFRGADLQRVAMTGATILHADLTDADLRGVTGLGEIDFVWPWLCRTALPEGISADRDRDCRDAVEAPLEPIAAPDQPTPYVAVTGASVDDGPGPRRIRAHVDWDALSARADGMTAGHVRILAVDARTQEPTVLRDLTYDDVTHAADVDVTIGAADLLRAMQRGNRIVLTATQHQPAPGYGRHTTRTYVTVSVLQRGPGRGQVGKSDCSRVALIIRPTRDLDYCDLSGAFLDSAELDGANLRKADLTGAVLRRAALTSVHLDGASFAGVEGRLLDLTDVSAIGAWAPQLSMPQGTIDNSYLRARNLDGADFSGTVISSSRTTTTTTFATAPMRRASFAGANIVHTDFALADLSGSDFTGATGVGHNSFFLADLTRADMTGSTWDLAELQEIPWEWATLCHTKMPLEPKALDDGDRDCPVII